MGAVLAVRGRRSRAAPRDRETVLLYGLIGVLTFWASFGPAGGLYRLLYNIPMFSFLRAIAHGDRRRPLPGGHRRFCGAPAARRAGTRRALAATALTLFAVADLRPRCRGNER